MVPVLVLFMVPALTMLPLENQVVVLLLPLIFHCPLFVIVGVFEKAMLPSDQFKVPLLVRLTFRSLVLPVAIEKVFRTAR